MIQLRDYQQRSVNEIWQWLRENPTGNPLAVLPTAAGKSIICGRIIKEGIAFSPLTVRILVLTHSKELIEQNYEKFRLMSPETDTGIYAASLKRKELHNQVVFASIQSIARVSDIGYFNLVIVDEAHRIPVVGGGQYLTVLDSLRRHNSKIRVIGLTATPFRLDCGYLHHYGDEGIFSDIATEVTMAELIKRGYLSRMVPRKTSTTVSMKGVQKVGGEYNLQQAAARMMGHSETAIDDVCNVAPDRKHWLVFCVTVAHAEQVADILRNRGISAEVVSGKTPKAEREEIIHEYRSGGIQALVNCEVLTTGFDAPKTDLIVLLRPTKSTGLYIQMAGRGMRIAEGKDNCMMLDYAGNVEEHGCLDDPTITKRAVSDGTGEPPVKTCPKCEVIVPLGLTECSECGYQFRDPNEEPHLARRASTKALLKQDRPKKIVRYRVVSATYARHEKAGKPPTLRVTYYGHKEGSKGFDSIFTEKICSEWLSVEGQGYARERAFEWWLAWANPPFVTNVDKCLERLNNGEGRKPTGLVVDETDKYPRIIEYLTE